MQCVCWASITVYVMGTVGTVGTCMKILMNVGYLSGDILGTGGDASQKHFGTVLEAGGCAPRHRRWGARSVS